MRIFIVFDKDRHAVDINDGQTVKEILDHLQKKLRMNFNVDAQQKKYLTLEIQGSELKNDWIVTDLGFEPGTTFKCYLKEEEQPSLRIYLSFSGDTIPIFDDIDFYHEQVSDVRTVIQSHTGIPVSAFKLVCDKNKKQLFDGMTLYDYEVRHGDILNLETWDGWGPLLHAALMDLPHKVIGMGVRPDIPIGTHPATQWCVGDRSHVETQKAPIHVAAERDQLAFLKLIIAHNVTYCVARDGKQLTALSVALRKNNRKSASLLITKAWSKQPPSSEITFPLPIYTKLKSWCELAKDEIFTMYSGEKSSAKSRKWYHKTKANMNLVGQPLLLEGFSEDIMQSKLTRSKTIKSYDFNYRAATAQPRARLPAIRIETPPLVKRERIKYEARKSGIATHDIPNILEAALSDFRKPHTEPRPNLSRRKSRFFDAASFIRRENTNITFESNTKFADTTFDSLNSNDETGKKQRPMSVISRLSTRNSDRQILLPPQANKAHISRPPVFDANGGATHDALYQTINAVERKMGQSLREKAIESLNIASTFKKKAWLHQINLANNLSRNAIQRPITQSK